MVTIRKDNVYRIVTESDFNMIWKPQGFHIVKEETGASAKNEKNEKKANSKNSENSENPENLNSSDISNNQESGDSNANLQGNCADGTCEDALRAKLLEHGINAHHFKSRENLQKMLDDVEKKKAEGKEVDTELETLKGEARECGIKIGGFDTVKSLKKKIAESNSENPDSSE